MNRSSLSLIAIALAASGCTTVCITGVRESAAVQCAPGEAWETCIAKVEKNLDETQAKALELLKSAAAPSTSGR